MVDHETQLESEPSAPLAPDHTPVYREASADGCWHRLHVHRVEPQDVRRLKLTYGARCPETGTAKRIAARPWPPRRCPKA